jgi:hypothetical protein
MLERGYVDPAEETDKVPFATNASGVGQALQPDALFLPS